jgi:hypothetical protein
MFTILRRWFDVPSSVALDLTAIDSAVVELGEPRLIAAMAMRKLQALHLLATPGVKTSTDVVVAIVQDLQRALIQAPTMRLKLQASSTDWDDALRTLEAVGDGAADDAPDRGSTTPTPRSTSSGRCTRCCCSPWTPSSPPPTARSATSCDRHLASRAR